MRAIWSGEIAFGLVTVPVKLHSATKDLTPKFHLIHKKCGTRVQMVRRCPKCEVDVAWDEIERGYEVATGEVARFSANEIAGLEEDEAKGILEIVEFVDPSEVDLSFIEKSYWVAPGGKNARSFMLLHTVLAKTGRVAVAKVAIRSRTRLALLRPRGKMFALDMMRFAEELVGIEDIEAPAGKAPTEKELSLAKSLVDQLTAPFDPEKHPDAYRARVLALAEEKAEAGETAHAKTKTSRAANDAGNVVDLSALLAKSLHGAHAAKGKPAKAAAHPHARTKATVHPPRKKSA